MEQVPEEPVWEALRPYMSVLEIPAEAPDSTELEQRRQVRATLRSVFLMKQEPADGQALVGSPLGLCDHMCKQYTVRAHFFFSCSFCQRACPSLLSQLSRSQPHSHALTPRHTRGSRSTLFVFCPKTVTPHRAMSYVTPHLSITPTPGTCTPSLSSTQSSSRPLFSQLEPCAALRPHLSGALAEPLHRL